MIILVAHIHIYIYIYFFIGPHTNTGPEMKRSASTNLVSSISFELFVIGVLNKYGDVTDVRGDGGIVVNHGDGSFLGAHF